MFVFPGTVQIDGEEYLFRYESEAVSTNEAVARAIRVFRVRDGRPIDLPSMTVMHPDGIEAARLALHRKVGDAVRATHATDWTP